MSNRTIRQAVPEDLSEIQRLNQALFQFEDDGHFNDDPYNLNWPYEAAGVLFFEKCLAEKFPDHVAFIAESDGRAIGYLAGSFTHKAFRASNRPFAELDNMYVEEAFRHTGVGVELYAAFKAWLARNHVDRVKVSAYAKNSSAINFYRSLGYTDAVLTLEMSV